jgi:hypothetical protein
MALAPSPTAAATRFIDRVQAAERRGRLADGRAAVGQDRDVGAHEQAAGGLRERLPRGRVDVGYGGAEAIRPAGDQDRP